jgi:hypothetical protein
VLVLSLAGCGTEAGPAPRPPAQEPGPDALPTKLGALSADQCYLSPQTQLPKGCEKFVTELGGTAGTVRKRAGSTDKALAAQADALDRGITSYRGTGCSSVPTPGGPCTQALVDISAALKTIKLLVSAPAKTG